MKETLQHDGCTIEIIQDEDARNPREDFDHFGTMVCFHRKYTLGDVDGRATYGSGEGFIRALAGDHTDKDVQEMDIEDCQKIVDQHYILLPLSLLDHSGLRMRIGSSAWECDPGGWDSGQVGWIYVSIKDALENWSAKTLQDLVPYEHDGTIKTVRERAEDLLECEVEEFDKYLSGDVWGYVVTHDESGKEESCWGFFGYDSCVEEAKSITDYLNEQWKKEQAEQHDYACRC